MSGRQLHADNRHFSDIRSWPYIALIYKMCRHRGVRVGWRWLIFLQNHVCQIFRFSSFSGPFEACPGTFLLIFRTTKRLLGSRKALPAFLERRFSSICDLRFETENTSFSCRKGLPRLRRRPRCIAVRPLWQARKGLTADWLRSRRDMTKMRAAASGWKWTGWKICK